MSTSSHNIPAFKKHKDELYTYWTCLCTLGVLVFDAMDDEGQYKCEFFILERNEMHKLAHTERDTYIVKACELPAKTTTHAYAFTNTDGGCQYAVQPYVESVSQIGDVWFLHLGDRCNDASSIVVNPC